MDLEFVQRTGLVVLKEGDLMVRPCQVVLLASITHLALSAAAVFGQPAKATADIHGDPLPPGALARFGTARWQLKERCVAVWYTSDGKTLVSVNGGHVCLWDGATGKKLREVEAVGSWLVPASGKGRPTGGTTLAPVGGHVAWIDDGSVRLGDGDSAVKTVAEPGKGLDGGWKQKWVRVCFSADGKRLAAIRADSLVACWDVTSGSPLFHPAQPAFPYREQEVAALAFSPDGKTLAAGIGWRIHFFDANTGKLRENSRLRTVYQAALSPDNRTLVTVDFDQSLCVWNAGTGKLRQRCPVSGAPELGEHVLFAPDSKTFVFGVAESHWWDALTGAKKLRLPPPAEGRAARNLLAFSPDGSTLLTLEPGGVLCAWDLVSGKPRRRVPLKALDQEVYPSLAIAAAPFAALATETDLLMLDAWDRTRTYLVLPTIPKRLAWEGLSDPASGHTVVLHLPREFVLVEGRTGKVRRRHPMPDASGPSVVLSPDGRLLALRQGDRVRVRSVTTGKEIISWPAHAAGVYWVFFSDDGSRLVTVGNDNTLLVWDMAGMLKEYQPPQRKLTDADLEELWADLASDDAERAFGAIHAVAESPAQVLPFMRMRVQPLPQLDGKQLRQWLADLDSDSFATRQKATKQLEDRGDVTLPHLRRALKDGVSLEMRLRVELLQRRIGEALQSSNHLRFLRALEVLEIIATPEALELLETLARGAPEGRLTVEAGFSARRLRGRLGGQLLLVR